MASNVGQRIGSDVTAAQNSVGNWRTGNQNTVDQWKAANDAAYQKYQADYASRIADATAKAKAAGLAAQQQWDQPSQPTASSGWDRQNGQPASGGSGWDNQNGNAQNPALSQQAYQSAYNNAYDQALSGYDPGQFTATAAPTLPSFGDQATVQKANNELTSLGTDTGRAALMASLAPAGSQYTPGMQNLDAALLGPSASGIQGQYSGILSALDTASLPTIPTTTYASLDRPALLPGIAPPRKPNDVGFGGGGLGAGSGGGGW